MTTSTIIKISGKNFKDKMKNKIKGKKYKRLLC